MFFVYAAAFVPVFLLGLHLAIRHVDRVKFRQAHTYQFATVQTVIALDEWDNEIDSKNFSQYEVDLGYASRYIAKWNTSTTRTIAF